MKEFFRMLMTVCLVGAAWAAFWYFFGEVQITASYEGSRIDGARVFVDGKYAGKTPYKTRLLPGIHNIAVKPPVGYDANLVSETLHLFTMGRGVNHTVAFSVPPQEEY